MTTRYCSNDSDLRAFLAVGNPGDRYVLNAGVYGGLDSYLDNICGGTTWATRTKIEARVRSGVRDVVTLRPSGCEFVVRLAHPVNSYIELVGLDLDATDVSLSAVKVTYSGTDSRDQAHHVRFAECELSNSYNQGAMVTSNFVSFVRCRIHHNGTTRNLDHGIYMSGLNGLVQGCDVHHNAAIGICAYDGSGELKATGFRALNNRCWSNGQAGTYGDGILLASGVEQEAIGNVCWDNDYGVRVYSDAQDATVLRNVTHGNRYGGVFVHPEAVATTLLGSGIDANVEVG